MTRNDRKGGAGDRDRTGDIQLGKLASTLRPTQNQANSKGHVGLSTALLPLIEHNSEHNFTTLALQNPQPPHTKNQDHFFGGQGQGVPPLPR